jgi:hypothetical protein
MRTGAPENPPEKNDMRTGAQGKNRTKRYYNRCSGKPPEKNYMRRDSPRKPRKIYMRTGPPATKKTPRKNDMRTDAPRKKNQKKNPYENRCSEKPRKKTI